MDRSLHSIPFHSLVLQLPYSVLIIVSSMNITATIHYDKSLLSLFCVPHMLYSMQMTGP